jgi:hypothetical protein
MASHLSAPEEKKPRGRARARIPLAVALVLGSVLVIGAGVVSVLPLLPKADRSDAQFPVPSATASTTPAPVPTLGPLDRGLKSRVLFGHDELGANITSGVPKAYQNAKLTAPRVAVWKKVMRDKQPVFAHALVGESGDPRSRLKDFAALVNDAPRGSIDVALMNFSYADVTADSDVGDIFGQYTATMEALENAHPDVVFLYTTVPVTTENSWKQMDAAKVTGLAGAVQPVWQHNIARERYNALVRERYAASGRLFDIAALEARIKGDRVAAKEHQGQWFYVLNPALAAKDGRRLNSTGSTRLATELLRMVEAVTKG